MQAGVLTNILDGPLEKIKTSVDSMIINTMETLQKSMDSAQENVDKFVVSAQDWATNTQTQVRESLRGILQRVCIYKKYTKI